MFYAIYHPYGINTISACDLLIRFKTRAERDGWVDADVFRDNYHRENVSCDMARKHFPKAFRAVDYVDGDMLAPCWCKYLDGDPMAYIPGAEIWNGCRVGF